jgi:hypothetical protein
MNKTLHRQYNCQIPCVHYFDICMTDIPSHVQFRFKIKSNFHMTYNISTNAFDTRVKAPFVLSLYTQYRNVYLVLCQMNNRLKYAP